MVERNHANPQEVVFSVTNEPEVPEEPEIDKTLPKDVIKYKNRIFEVPKEMIYYLGDLPENLSARINMALEYGMSHIAENGIYSCLNCKFSKHNINDIVDDMKKSKSPKNTSNECHSYTGLGVTWVTAFSR